MIQTPNINECVDCGGRMFIVIDKPHPDYKRDEVECYKCKRQYNYDPTNGEIFYRPKIRLERDTREWNSKNKLK